MRADSMLCFGLFLAALLIVGCQAQKVEKLNERTSSLLLQLETLERGFEELHDSLKKVKTAEEEYTASTKASKKSLADFGVLVESFKNDLALVRGKLEEHSYLLGEIKKDVDRSKKDFDFRLNELEKGRPAEKEKAESKGSDAEMMMYQKGVSEFQKGNYEGAISLFSAFLSDYPDSPLAGSVAFLVGKSYFYNEKWADAVANFQALIEKYPKHAKRCEAQYLQGFAFEKLKQNDVALIAYEEVVKTCKGDEASPKAEARLVDLRKEHPKASAENPKSADPVKMKGKKRVRK